MLFYTRQGLEDVKAGLIRPSTHALRSKLATFWAVDPRTGHPHVTPVYLTRCLIRYLKGHGNDYAFDRHTWRFYRANKLNRISLFKVGPWRRRSWSQLGVCAHVLMWGRWRGRVHGLQGEGSGVAGSRTAAEPSFDTWR
jgi:hypothetical protein